MTSLWAEIRHTEVTLPVYDVAGYGCFATGGGRKIAFTSRPEAVTYMKRRGLSLSPYRCPSCSNWHLTSTPQ